MVPHQDNSFLYTEPRSCTGLWLALEDATIANGCLWAIPGSQKSSFLIFADFLLQLLWSFFSCKNERLWNFCGLIFLHFIFVDGLIRRFIRGDEGVTFDRPSPEYDHKDFVPIEVKAGSLVVIHGDLIHQRSVGGNLFLFCPFDQ